MTDPREDLPTTTEGVGPIDVEAQPAPPVDVETGEVTPGPGQQLEVGEG